MFSRFSSSSSISFHCNSNLIMLDNDVEIEVASNLKVSVSRLLFCSCNVWILGFEPFAMTVTSSGISPSVDRTQSDRFNVESSDHDGRASAHALIPDRTPSDVNVLSCRSRYRKLRHCA